MADTFLSQSWLDRQRQLGAKLPQRKGASARVQYKVTGAPGGEVTFHTVIEDGRFVESALGEDTNADLIVTVPYADFVKINAGEVDGNVAFMQGRLKTAAGTRVLLSLMPLTTSAEYREVLAELDTATEY